jgi:beta-1,4-mannooligosaccharide/beta-1,4-mannosyl-N-acetylglucosamine phosphorylase
MVPEMDYEQNGNVPQVVFPTAVIPHFEKDEMDIYYGAADKSICLAKAEISKIVDACLADGPLSYEYNPRK